MADPIVQLTKAGAAVSSVQDVSRVREHFERLHVIRLAGFLEPAVLHLAQRRLAEAAFKDKVHEHIGVELSLTAGPALDLLMFLANDPVLFAFVEALTGCDRIGCFMGRIYRMVPGGGHYDSWHSDAVEHRMVGMSVNLGPEVYAGGVFQLREKASDTILQEAINTTPGDAILFRISTFLEHRITAVEGTRPKTAFAGWFKSEPAFLSLLGPDQVAGASRT